MALQALRCMIRINDRLMRKGGELATVIVDLRASMGSLETTNASQLAQIAELKAELHREKTASRQVLSSLSMLDERKRKRLGCGSGRLPKKEQDKENELLALLAAGQVAIKALD
jgi:ferritin-like protein